VNDLPQIRRAVQKPTAEIVDHSFPSQETSTTTKNKRDIKSKAKKKKRAPFSLTIKEREKKERKTKNLDGYSCSPRGGDDFAKMTSNLYPVPPGAEEKEMTKESYTAQRQELPYRPAGRYIRYLIIQGVKCILLSRR